MGDRQWLADAAAVFLGIVFFVLGQPAAVAPASAETCGGGQADQPPQFVYPQEGAMLPANDDVVFEVSGQEGSQYRWVLYQDGEEVERAVKPGHRSAWDAPDELYHLYLRYMLVGRGGAATAPNLAATVSLTSGSSYAVWLGTEEHDRLQRGPLLATVSARVCREWTPPATLSVTLG